MRGGRIVAVGSTREIRGLARSGQTQQHDLRGRMVLLEFWSTSCGPCRFDAPKNVAYYKTLPRAKVEFLGVSSDESAQTLAEFEKEFGMTWPQLREPFEGPIHRQYRVDGEPTYYLIGADGNIVDKWMGGGLAVDRMKKALGN